MSPKDLSAFLQSYPGGISVEEGLALCRYAAACTGGVIVEIGSSKGKSSSIALAAGHARNVGMGADPVYCFEPHRPFLGRSGGIVGTEHRRDFYKVMLDTGFVERVAVVDLPSDVAGKSWTAPIGLLFLGGDHSIGGVKSDIATWERHVLPGGIIVFDDALDPATGTYQVIRQLVDGGRFVPIETVGKTVALRKTANAASPRSGRRILVACHELSVAGGLYRFERFGRIIRRFGHELAFLAFSKEPERLRTTEFPVLTLDDARRATWDATFVPGAGFPDETIDAFAQLTDVSFGVRTQHILNDQVRRRGFLKVNEAFRPHVVVFNNRHWQPGDFTEFDADAFHWLEGAVDVEALAPDPGRRRADRDTAFVVGGLANKNVAPLIEAVRICGESVHLHLFGYADGLLERAPDLVAGGRLRSLGIIDDARLSSFYANLDCVVHTEAFAGWANVAAEGMACGVPVVCTPHGTAAFAEHETTAIVVEEPNPQSFAAAIMRLRDDPEEAEALTRRARRRIASFSWSSYSAELLRLTEKPACRYHTHAPELALFGKWPEATRVAGLDPVLNASGAKTVWDLGAGDGIVALRFLESGAAGVDGFERDGTQVALAQRICGMFASASFRRADLSDWDAFETQHAEHLRDVYDIVLYLDLHHDLSELMRMQALVGAARRAAEWFVVRTPEALFRDDDIEAVLAALDFSLADSAATADRQAGDTYCFRKNLRTSD